MWSLLLTILSPVGRIMLIAVVALAALVWVRNDIRKTAKTEVTQKITTNEIQKLKNADKAQDRTRRDHLRKPNSLRDQNDGYRRD